MPKWRFACPRGHRSLVLSTNRFHCYTCDDQGRTANFDMDDLYDLANGEEPPHG